MAFEQESLTESQKMVIMRTNLLQVNTDIIRLKKAVFEGDGESELPALERIRNLEKFQAAIQFWFRTIAVAIVLQTVTFGFVAIVAFVRFYPLLEKLAQNP